MPHPSPRWRGPARDVCVDRLSHPFRTLRGLLLRGPADLADKDDALRLPILRKELERLWHRRPNHRIPANAQAGGFPEARVRDRVHDFIRERATAGDHANVAGPEDVVWHDPRFRFSGGYYTRRIRPNHATALRLRIRDHIEAVVEWDLFRDDHEKSHTRLDCLDRRVLRERCGDEHDRRVRAGFVDALEAGVEDGNVMHPFPRLARGHARHDLRAVVEHRARIELALMARDSLDDELRLLIQEDGHSSTSCADSHGEFSGLLDCLRRVPDAAEDLPRPVFVHTLDSRDDGNVHVHRFEGYLHANRDSVRLCDSSEHV